MGSMTALTAILPFVGELPGLSGVSSGCRSLGSAPPEKRGEGCPPRSAHSARWLRSPLREGDKGGGVGATWYGLDG